MMRPNQLIPSSLRRLLRRVKYAGNKRHCSICDERFRKFQNSGVDPRPDAKCPVCGSLERHRFLWRYLESRTNFFELSGAKMLHIAPEACLEDRFRGTIGTGYLTADLFAKADIKMDITDIQFPDNAFDIVYCSHVLEHVPDDRKAMLEFWRVLKPDGWAIIMVPITAEDTNEDPSVTDPKERLRLYGQEDHVRRYGPDVVDRLREAGFSVTAISPNDLFSAEEIERLGCPREFAGDIFHCRKVA